MRTVSFQMLRLEMGGTKGGAGALTMQMDSCADCSLWSRLQRGELCVGRCDGLQQEWRNCIKGQKLFGWSSSHKVVEGQDCARTGAADANNNMENVGRRQEVPESGPGNGYKYV